MIVEEHGFVHLFEVRLACARAAGRRTGLPTRNVFALRVVMESAIAAYVTGRARRMLNFEFRKPHPE